MDRKDLDLLLDYEKIMFIDEVSKTDKDEQIIKSAMRIFLFFGRRKLSELLNINNAEQIKTSLSNELRRKSK